MNSIIINNNKINNFLFPFFFYLINEKKSMNLFSIHSVKKSIFKLKSKKKKEKNKKRREERTNNTHRK